MEHNCTQMDGTILFEIDRIDHKNKNRNYGDQDKSGQLVDHNFTAHFPGKSISSADFIFFDKKYHLLLLKSSGKVQKSTFWRLTNRHKSGKLYPVQFCFIETRRKR
jgi:hypothetical protein